MFQRYNILPEYCQYGYLAGVIATYISNTCPQLVQWFTEAFLNHCLRFTSTHEHQYFVSSFWTHVLHVLMVKVNIDINPILIAFNSNTNPSVDEWMDLFVQYIMPVLENNIEHILEVK